MDSWLRARHHHHVKRSEFRLDCISDGRLHLWNVPREVATVYDGIDAAERALSALQRELFALIVEEFVVRQDFVAEVIEVTIEGEDNAVLTRYSLPKV
ncbi:hypothetical protein J5289_27145 (plasmid) [Rhizobium sp. B230/85]|uniref:hypothetical protein n=1 Tax=unclassified Rhizobium TaxID=2613769 RepID=UPI001ADA5A0E|nr:MULTISPECIES: hypothetical protein [unclassified Rhizobium]MBO9134472.1 hypothetical protein [Rhizobium sp. B209b/85]QXZ99680.1 hypothetical protein J5289_27145 [Rhizobium sp. B230/85]